MLRSIRLPLAIAALAAVPCLVPVPAAADEFIPVPGFVPKADTYLCPNAEGAGAIDCYLEAVEHLYTMCRHIKSIEVLEFGYEKAEEGVNSAKTEYCVDKHKVSITRPYQAALKQATGNRTIVDHLRALQERWARALAELKWVPGESDSEYKDRVAQPYAFFHERADAVRAVLASMKSKPTPALAGAKKPAAAGAAKPAVATVVAPAVTPPPAPVAGAGPVDAAGAGTAPAAGAGPAAAAAAKAAN
jgi:hypothetical protein